MQSTMEDAAGIYRTGPEMAKGIDTLRELQHRIGRVGIADTSRSFNTELLAALELANMLDIGECILQSGLQREESRGAHQRTDFPDRDDDQFLKHQLVYRNRDGTPRVESTAGDHHSLASRRTGLRKVAMSSNGDSIRLEVTRYQPEGDSEPRLQEYDVPLRKEWTVLDGLNHVKDEVDTTLSFRWSCRMGICGSCGMNVDGEPKLTCATFLSDYAPGPVRVEPLSNFPIIRDLVVDIDDFMQKLPKVKPWIIRDDDVTEIDGEYLQTPEELDAYKQFSMCINCMLCYAACPVYGLDPEFMGPAAIALAERYDLDSRDHGARERLDVLIEHEGVWGCTFVGECTTVCPKHVDPAGAIQRYKLKAAKENVKAFVLPRFLQ